MPFFQCKNVRNDALLTGQTLQAGASHDISFLLTGGGLAGSSLTFMAKGSTTDSDDSAQITKVGAIAPAVGDFVLTIADNRMTGTVALEPADTRALPVGLLYYAFQWQSSDGKRIEEWGGTFSLSPDLIKEI